MSVFKSCFFGWSLAALFLAGPIPLRSADDAPWVRVTEDERALKIETDKLEAVIPKSSPKRWMTGIEKASFLDKASGFREVGDGLMVIDWLMKPVQPEVIRGKDFIAVKTTYKFEYAAPGRKAGSQWTQLIVFPKGERYFVLMDRIDSVNESPEMFLRNDTPGCVRHEKGDTFSEMT